MNRTLMLAVVGAAVLGLGLGAAAGYLTQPPASSAAAAAAGTGQTAAAAGQSAAAGGQGGASGRARQSASDGTQTPGRAPTSGTVEQVDASKLTVRTEGGTVDVPLSETTVVQKLDKAAAADLKVGDLVVGRGSADAQGALHVSALQIMPAGTERGGAGGFGGAAGKPGGFGGAGAAAKPGDGRGGQTGGSSGGGGADGRFGGVVGTIAKIDGATLVVTTPNGDVTATLAADAEVRRLTQAGRDEIKAGQTVTVVGGPSGTRTVVTITAV